MARCKPNWRWKLQTTLIEHLLNRIANTNDPLFDFHVNFGKQN